DNPRYEQPLSIVSDIEAGLTEVAYKVLLNRYEATSLALDIASSIDTVVILGKGAEKFQEVKGKKIPYSDTDTVLSLFSAYGVK
ncbi:MAG: UDP-N-acetylmuramoyl-L-alanyl-D-glutamate--2,6-diaminopimelate ligase, partial [Clostridia bacterium]